MMTLMGFSFFRCDRLCGVRHVCGDWGDFFPACGVKNLGVEGIMLMGAVSGYIAAVNTQNLALSFLVVLLVGAVFGLVFAFLTVTLQADQTVCGMAMLTFGTGF